MNNLKHIVEEELQRGLEAISQLRSLHAQNPHVMSDYYENNEERSEALMNVTENYSNTIINSFDTSLAIVRKIVQSFEKQPPSLSSSSRIKPKADACPSNIRLRTIEVSDLTPDGHIWRKYGKKSISNSKHPKLRTIEVSDLTPDGHIWRKYGKKSITNSKHPKEYYKCAYKDEQNCEAIKHVQKISENPTKYRIAYFAQHICQPLINNKNGPSIKILESNEKDCDAKNLISPYTQTLDHDVLDQSSSSKNEVPPLLSSTMNDHPVHQDALPPTTMFEPTIDDYIEYFSCPEQIYSPTAFVTEDFSLMTMNNLYDASDELLQDLPLWE